MQTDRCCLPGGPLGRQGGLTRIAEGQPWTSASVALTTMLEAAGFTPWIASYTSSRCTGTSFGATIPRRTLSPRISTTVTTMSLLMMMDSFFFLDSTSIGVYLSVSPGEAATLTPPGPPFRLGSNPHD